MPYPNEHACRLRDPDDFQSGSFRRTKRKHDDKSYFVISGRLKGEETMTEQAYRYPKDMWSADEARTHCRSHDGLEFAPATGGRTMSVCCLDKVKLRGFEPEEFRFVGSPRNPYGTHASKGYPGGRDAWKKAWRIYLSCVRDQGPIQGTVRRVSMIAAAMKPKCQIPSMSAEDMSPRSGSCGCQDGKVYQKPSDYDLSKWKVPSDDDLEQEDVQLTCQDLTDIKRICLQEIAKRHACEEEKKSMMGIERRFLPAEVRVTEDTGGQPHIVGYGAVFNEISLDLGGFREIIEPGAFSKTLQEADIRCLWNHNSDYVLGRNRSGTLQLRQEERGLRYDVVPPDATWARDLLSSIERGDVSQGSFGFETVRDTWDQDERGNVTRRLLEVKLFDIGPVTFAAYPQTSAEARSKVLEFQSRAVPGQEPHPAGADEEQARARLEILRRRLDLMERT